MAVTVDISKTGVSETTGIGGGTGQYILIRDEKPQGITGGIFTAGAWQTRALNTIVDDVGNNASLSTNQVTLQPGTYRCRILAPAYNVTRHQARLYNITNAATELLGSSSYTVNSVGISTLSYVMGRFTIDVATVFEVQHRCQITWPEGFGVAANFDTEIYTSIELVRE